MKKNLQILCFLYVIFFPLKNIAQNGCTDPQATNYNALATTNDGSCVYPTANVSVTQSISLPSTLSETSGLIDWNSELYTHNDNTDTNLYKINATDGSIVQNIPLSSLTNIDWEEISQDENYLYIGDFGNNVSGNRTNLKIYKIQKSTTANPIVETINFSYANQTDFSAQGSNTTNFDCEAFVVTSSAILLFTKQWTANQTTIYSLPKTAGTHVANPITTLNMSGLITGATLLENYNLIALTGYSATLSPFIYLIYDFQGTNFQQANKRKINLNLGFHQVEAITSINGLDYFITNENFVYAPFVNNPQKLHTLSLAPYTSLYINNLLATQTPLNIADKITVFPNPTTHEVFLMGFNAENISYEIYNTLGKQVQKGQASNRKIDFQNLKKGIYFIRFLASKEVIKIIKI